MQNYIGLTKTDNGVHVEQGARFQSLSSLVALDEEQSISSNEEEDEEFVPRTPRVTRPSTVTVELPTRTL